jgi:hypothetical protein
MGELLLDTTDTAGTTMDNGHIEVQLLQWRQITALEALKH